jgi:hypothetical protein
MSLNNKVNFIFIDDLTVVFKSKKVISIYSLEIY